MKLLGNIVCFHNCLERWSLCKRIFGSFSVITAAHIKWIITYMHCIACPLYYILHCMLSLLLTVLHVPLRMRLLWLNENLARVSLTGQSGQTARERTCLEFNQFIKKMDKPLETREPC